MLNTALTKNTDGTYTITKVTEGIRQSKKIDIEMKVNKEYMVSYELIETDSAYGMPIQFVVHYEDGSGQIIQIYKTDNSVKFIPEKQVSKIEIYQEGAVPVGTYTTLRIYR